MKSDFGDPRIWMQRATKPLPAPAYASGWHPGMTLDYVALGLSSDAGWELVDLDGATERILDAVHVGAEVSVYATSSGGSYAGSAHKIHRNGRGDDGAIVVNPLGAAPQWLFFRFDNQTF
ncbi:MAG: hypothetical protein JNG84_12040 [Archangium sp.]|nr:hypothetical protein [Archangium sp.]